MIRYPASLECLRNQRIGRQPFLFALMDLALILCLLFVTPEKALAQSNAEWQSIIQQCRLPAGTYYNDWVAQGSPCNTGSSGGGGLSLPSVGGGGGYTPQRQMMLNGAGMLGNAIGQALGQALFGNPQQDAAQAAARAAAQRQQQQLFDAAKQFNDNGIYLFKQKNYAGAINEFQQALAKTPNDPNILQNLAQAKQELKDTAVAAQNSGALTQLLGSAPANAGNIELSQLTPSLATPVNGSALNLVNLDSDPNVVDLRGTTKTAVDLVLLKNDSAQPSTQPADPQQTVRALDSVLGNGAQAASNAPPEVQNQTADQEQTTKALDHVLGQPPAEPNQTSPTQLATASQSAGQVDADPAQTAKALDQVLSQPRAEQSQAVASQPNLNSEQSAPETQPVIQNQPADAEQTAKALDQELGHGVASADVQQKSDQAVTGNTHENASAIPVTQGNADNVAVSGSQPAIAAGSSPTQTQLANIENSSRVGSAALTPEEASSGARTGFDTPERGITDPVQRTNVSSAPPVPMQSDSMVATVSTEPSSLKPNAALTPNLDTKGMGGGPILATTGNPSQSTTSINVGVCLKGPDNPTIKQKIAGIQNALQELNKSITLDASQREEWEKESAHASRDAWILAGSASLKLIGEIVDDQIEATDLALKPKPENRDQLGEGLKALDRKDNLEQYKATIENVQKVYDNSDLLIHAGEDSDSLAEASLEKVWDTAESIDTADLPAWVKEGMPDWGKQLIPNEVKWLKINLDAWHLVAVQAVSTYRLRALNNNSEKYYAAVNMLKAKMEALVKLENAQAKMSNGCIPSDVASVR